MTHDDAKRRSDELAAQIKKSTKTNATNAALNLLAAKSNGIDGLPARGVVVKEVMIPLPHGGEIKAKVFEGRFGNERYQAGERADAEAWVAKRVEVWSEKRSETSALAEGRRLAHLASRLVSEYSERTNEMNLSARQKSALMHTAVILAELEEAFNDKE